MPTYRAPPDERTKGVLRILVADKFTGSQISEIADLLEIPPAFVSGSNKSDRAASIIRRLAPDKLKELVGMVLGDGFVRPGPTSGANLAAEAALRAACIVDGPGDPPSVEAPSRGFSRDLVDELPHGVVTVNEWGSAPPAAPSGATPVFDVHGAKPKRTFDLPEPAPPLRGGTPAVFIVHGHDEGSRESVARLIEKLGLEAIVLHEQPNEGQTIIEKFEKQAARVVYAVVLLTADDIGATKSAPQNLKRRARQNVIFELGYLSCELGRSNVCAIYEEGVEIPSDYSGMLYVAMDPRGAWRMTVAREMKKAGLPVDLNKL